MTALFSGIVINRTEIIFQQWLLDWKLRVKNSIMDDDTYTFHNVYIPVVTRTTGGGEDAHKVQDVVATAWLNFAKTGSPSQDGLEWKPYTEDEQNTMVLKEESECRDLGDETLRGLIMSALGQE